MTIRSYRALAYALVLLLLNGLGASQLAAQDNSQGRYRPEGRLVGTAAGREFDERIYEVRTYDVASASDAFSDAMVFYPLTLSFDPPNGAIAFVPGFRANPSMYEWWGPALASLGYSVFILNTNEPTDGLADRAAALSAAVDLIAAENSRDDSPVRDKLDTDKIVLMGHSMGGGATLAAAAELGDRVAAVVPLAPYCCEPGGSFEGDHSEVTQPTLILASAVDEVAPPAEHAKMLYDSVGGTKIYAEFAAGDHMFPSNSGEDKTAMSRLVLAFLKVHLDDRQNLASIISSGGDQFARYLTE